MSELLLGFLLSIPLSIVANLLTPRAGQLVTRVGFRFSTRRKNTLLKEYENISSIRREPYKLVAYVGGYLANLTGLTFAILFGLILITVRDTTPSWLNISGSIFLLFGYWYIFSRSRKVWRTCFSFFYFDEYREKARKILGDLPDEEPITASSEGEE